jgi:hypothetical protein
MIFYFRIFSLMILLIACGFFPLLLLVAGPYGWFLVRRLLRRSRAQAAYKEALTVRVREARYAALMKANW